MASYYPAPLLHYHGHIVKRLFFVAAVVMLIGLPFFSNRLPIHTVLSLTLIVAIGLFSGFTNPVKRWPVFIDTIISIIGTLVFEYYAADYYQTFGIKDIVFWVSQILAVLFVVALYYGIKTLRAMMLDE
ncbi:MAG TPA: hypothetical protein VFK07_00755 [Candidatus Paceibacterota bacterium]|nr:hypothetical protein [Candidatus Paceibacterota bacterium]